MTAPLFSVVIPTYNRIALLREALASVSAQSFTDYEVIVVDDGSDDGSAEWLATEERVRVLRQANRGPGAARNRGAREARGRYIAFLDSDDLWPPWTLGLFAEAAAGPTRPVLIFGSQLEVPLGQAAPPAGPPPGPPDIRRHRDFLASGSESIFFGSGICAVDRDQFNAIGGFDETLRVGEDLDMFLRLPVGCGFAHIARPFTLVYRRHLGGLTANTADSVTGMLFLLEGERRGRYPGGQERAAERSAIITRSVRSVSFGAARAGMAWSAFFPLYWRTLRWHLRLGRFKYIFGFPAMLLLLRIAKQ